MSLLYQHLWAGQRRVSSLTVRYITVNHTTPSVPRPSNPPGNSVCVIAPQLNSLRHLSPARPSLLSRSILHCSPAFLRSQSTLATMEAPIDTRTAQIKRLAEQQLEQPQLDDRSYRVIQLPNQLQALLIHDPETDKASAALDVNVGSFSDPRELPGVAHAVEHMLFMGTEKVRASTAAALQPHTLGRKWN